MGQSASTTLTLITPPAETACPAFCLRHDPLNEDLCIGPVLELDFGSAATDNPDLADHARILTYSEPDGTAVLTLVASSAGGVGRCDFTPARARQIAAALIQAAEITEGGVR